MEMFHLQFEASIHIYNLGQIMILRNLLSHFIIPGFCPEDKYAEVESDYALG